METNTQKATYGQDLLAVLNLSLFKVACAETLSCGKTWS